jgi:thiol:disulfide interchange protein
MPSSPGQSGSSARKTQWWCVLALFVGAAAFESFGVLPLVAPYMAAVAAVWGAVLLATHPWVVRRIPNTRGAIVLTGVVIAVGLTMYAVNTGHLHGHAHAMEHAVSSP